MNLKKTIENKFGNYLKDNNLEVANVLMHKEDDINFLRVFLKGGEMTMHRIEAATRFLNRALDENDPIDGHYVLDVGSIGTDITIDNDKIDTVIGKNLIISFLDKKVIRGKLKLDKDKNYILIEDLRGRIKKHEIHVLDILEIKIEAKA